MSKHPGLYRFWQNRFFIFVIFVGVQIICSPVGRAQPSQDWEACSGRGNPSFDQRVKACTAIIDLPAETSINLAKAYGNRGVAYQNRPDSSAAIRDYDRSLALDSTSSSGRRFSGNKYLLHQQYDRAIAEYDEAIRLDPTNAHAFNGRGLSHRARKEYDEALADLNEAIRLDPNYAVFFSSRGLIYSAKGDASRAIVEYDQAIRLNPKAASPFVNRGLAYHAKTEYDRAIADYGEAIQLNPKYPTAFIARGQAFREKGDLVRAIADYDQAIKIDPGHASAYTSRCGERIKVAQDLKGALSDCNESLRLQPNQVRAFSSRGFAYLKLGSIAQAIADFDAALANDAKDAWSLYGRGLAKSKTTDASGAKADIIAAGKVRSDIARAIAKYYGVVAEPDFASRLAVDRARENPMIFVIAEGGSDACGASCSEWIAADGAFDPGAEKRFRDLLGTLNGRKLPIFFNSIGGSMGQAFAIGRILRERKMTASVGATVPDGCTGNTAEPSCRQIMQSRRILKARLRMAGAICHSACVYALMGASVREIPTGALLGVHAPIRPSSPNARPPRSRAQTDEQLHAARRRYAQQMGVDPELVDLADNTPYVNIHLLSRDEIARFQMETPRR